MLQPTFSAVRHPFSVNGLPLSDSPAKPEDLFAIIEFSGTQFKVTVVRFYSFIVYVMLFVLFCFVLFDFLCLYIFSVDLVITRRVVFLLFLYSVRLSLSFSTLNIICRICRISMILSFKHFDNVFLLVLGESIYLR